MPNWCSYSIKVNGSKEHRDAFLKKFGNYDEPNHFWRMGEPYVDEHDDCLFLDGDCAWSVEACCRSGGYSGGTDLLAVNTADLSLEIEIYSSEPGIGFEEHYIYSNGECLVAECVDMFEYYYDSSECTFEEFKTQYDLPNDITLDDLFFDYIRVGGFGDWDWSI